MKNKEINDYMSQNLFANTKHEREIIKKSIVFINKLRKAISENRNITLYADKDVDGISCVIFLEELIKEYAKSKNREVNVSTYIPSREDGYGISIETFMEFYNRGDYVFTLDNGTHKKFLDNLPSEDNDRIFIIDHHPNKFSKDVDYILNPNSEGDYIISTGYLLDYIYQILLQVDKDFGKNADRYKYADLVAMSLVSDMADLNNLRVRHLIQKGLEQIQKKERLLYKHLFPVKNGVITFNNIAFDLNPRINSIGRLSSNPNDAATILKYKDSSNRGNKAVEYLNSVNDLRKEKLNMFINLALDELKKKDLTKNNIIFYFNKDTPFGLNGLIAQKIYEIYNIPALVASQSKMTTAIKGSGRGHEIKHILNMFKDNDIFTYGGHIDALGVELKDFNIFNSIIERINTKKLYINKEFKNVALKDRYTIAEYKELSKQFSLDTKTIPFKQKFFVNLENTESRIKKVFKNNFCYLEIKDKNNPEEKISYFTRHNTAKEIVEKKESFFITIYAEYNDKKTVQDFGGDLVLERDISKSNEYEELIEINL